MNKTTWIICTCAIWWLYLQFFYSEIFFRTYEMLVIVQGALPSQKIIQCVMVHSHSSARGSILCNLILWHFLSLALSSFFFLNAKSFPEMLCCLREKINIQRKSTEAWKYVNTEKILEPFPIFKFNSDVTTVNNNQQYLWNWKMQKIQAMTAI